MVFPRLLLATILITICFINISAISEAQPDHSLGDWQIVVLKGRFTPKWSILCEEQIRNNNSDYTLKYDYLESKAGIYYAISGNLWGAIGAGYFDKYTTGGFFHSPELQKEVRTWLELYYKFGQSRIIIDHRLRLEQRYMPQIYKNRVKYRLGFIAPLNKPQIKVNSLYLAVNDELFIPQYGPLIERNYFFAGAGYVLTGNMALQIGCLKDSNYQTGNHTVKNYLQVILIYDFTNLMKKRT